MPDVMIDLETMGTRHDSVICSIGAVTFDINQIGDEFYRVVDIQSCIKRGMTVTGDTINWWIKNAKAWDIGPALEIEDALADLNLWIAEHDVKNYWANGPDFDLVILANAYRVCGLKHWLVYYNYRDVRTLRDIAFPGSRTIPGLSYAFAKHNSLEDAKHQAIGVQICMKKLAANTAGQ